MHILLQGSKSTPQLTELSTPSTSRAGSEPVEERSENADQPDKPTTSNVSTPVASSGALYACHACSFSTSRLNVMILHNKTHSISFTPYTPSPVRKKPTAKSSPKSTPVSSKTPKIRKPRKEKSDKEPKKAKGQKRSAESQPGVDAKKTKTDEEIKTSLLADWDDVDEDSHDEVSSPIGTPASPKVPVAAESPAVPVPADLTSAQLPADTSPPVADKKSDDVEPLKPESSFDSKYEFCEDEDWPTEADGGRKIPRVKNPSKRKDETKSVSIDEDEMAKEVAELLSKTTVPELPSAPEPLKIEENFPEPSVIKSPDKKREKESEATKSPENSVAEKPPTKTIFKTKTFFRSRHSRSQDAIGKYVAEQLNAVDRMNTSDLDLNGSEVASSPEARDSPPGDIVKVARLAPKIQLKKMKAEAAQMAEREKNNLEPVLDVAPSLVPVATTSVEPLLDVASPLVPEATTSSLVSEANTIPVPDISLPEISKTSLDRQNNSDSAVDTSISLIPDESGSCVNDKEEALVPDSSSRHFAPDATPNIIEPVNNITSTTTQDTVEVTRHENNFQLPVTEEEVPFEEPVPDKNIELEDIVEKPVLVQEGTQKECDSLPVETVPENPQEKDTEMYMNESTASAVDALLSVSSREADRVTKTISNDLPEDLFEDDKTLSPTNNVNGMEQTDFCFENGAAPSEQLQHEIGEVKKDIMETLEYGISYRKQETTSELSEKNDVDITMANEVSEELSTEIANEIQTVVESEVANDATDKISEVPDPVTEEVTNDETSFVTEEVTIEEIPVEKNDSEEVTTEIIPSESDLQIAEALMNLPATALKNKIPNDVGNNTQVSFESLEHEVISSESVLKSNSKFDTDFPDATHDDVQSRFETEQEKSENLNAAQSLVQMSETLDHKLKNMETNNTLKKTDKPQKTTVKENNNLEDNVEQKVALLSDANKSEIITDKAPKFKTSSSKLLKILEEPSMPKMISKVIPSKHIISAVQAKEKILNIDVANSPLKIKPQPPKQKIIIRRAPPNKNLINNLNEPKQEKIVLSRSNKPTTEGPAVQTYTIQASPDTPTDSNTIVIQQKVRKIIHPPNKLQKIKPQSSLVVSPPEAKPVNQLAAVDDALYDINSMPIVLSDDILTPESIEKMPIVMSDGNIISSSAVLPSPSKSVKPKLAKVEQEKIAVSASPNKPEMKTLLMNPVSDSSKATTPNILSKSSKLRGSKPMLVIDKVTGKQKIIMAKDSAHKEIKKAASKSPITGKVQAVGAPIATKPEKFIILPTNATPRPGRTQKIVIDPQTGKAHVLVGKASDPPVNVPDNKPVSAKIVPSAPDGATPGGGTVMIITNAQGTQSRIVLTPEHEKLLFPNKQLTNVSQIKTIAQRQVNSTAVQKSQTIVTTGQTAKTTRIVSKQKSAIITSKGQLIVGGRVATTAQNITQAPELRPVAPKRIIAAEPKKIIQATPKTNEPLIFLQQKSGAVMQLTAAQFEHLQKTGQIVQKSSVPTQPVKENKIVVQKSVTITSNEALHPVIQKQQRVRASRMPAASPSPAKKMKQEIALALAPPALPSLAPISHNTSPVIAPPLAPVVQTSIPTAAPSTSAYSDLENFEELLPSTAIVRQNELVMEVPPEEPVIPAPMVALAPAPVPTPAPAPQAQLSDGQLLAVPGEHFGGPPGSFYLCVEDNGSLTPIDNRPLVLENNQLVPMAVEPVLAPQPERRDILEAALANSDVFHADPPQNEAPDFRDLNANVSVHCRVSETSTTLNQPIMTPVEMPSKGETEPVVPTNLEDGLAVIGVTPHTVPTSLELPITVTDPRIAPKTTDPLSGNNYCNTTLLPSPSAEMTYVSCEETEISHTGPISMPLLTEEDDGVGKSMPILTDEVIGERTASSSVESALGSPSSLEVRECDAEEGGAWSRRLLTPGSDSSETSAEIPLQPPIQISVNDLSHNS